MPRPQRMTRTMLLELGSRVIGEDSVSLTSSGASDTDLDTDAGGLTDRDYTVGGVMLPLKVIEKCTITFSGSITPPPGEESSVP